MPCIIFLTSYRAVANVFSPTLIMIISLGLTRVVMPPIS